MWVWRDETAVGMAAPGGGGGRGGALDDSGSWTWSDPSLLARRGVGVDALRGRPALALIPAARVEAHGGSRPQEGRRLAPWYGPSATGRPAPTDVPGRSTSGGEDPTPIFHELTVDRTRRATLRPVPDTAHRTIPEPHPGSGPLPVQDPHGPRRGLAEVPTVPAPPGPGDDAVGYRPAGHAGSSSVSTPVSGPESPQDELRRRAERRRRPAAETSGGSGSGAGQGGRHALRAVEPAGGRHTLR